MCCRLLFFSGHWSYFLLCINETKNKLVEPISTKTHYRDEKPRSRIVLLKRLQGHAHQRVACLSREAEPLRTARAHPELLRRFPGSNWRIVVRLSIFHPAALWLTFFTPPAPCAEPRCNRFVSRFLALFPPCGAGMWVRRAWRVNGGCFCIALILCTGF